MRIEESPTLAVRRLVWPRRASSDLLLISGPPSEKFAVQYAPAYYPLRPTRLDEIKNLFAEIPVDALVGGTWPDSQQCSENTLAAPSCTRLSLDFH